MNDRIEEITKLINDLTTDLLVPIRTSKLVNKQAFSEFYKLLDEVIKLVKEKELINRNLAGLLFFIYTTISAEAEHTNYSSPIFLEASKIEDYLSKILWDSPFGKGIIW